MSVSREHLEQVIHDALAEFVGSGSGTYSVTDAVMAALAETQPAMAAAEAIVRDLATPRAPISQDEETCVFCDTVVAYKPVPPGAHEPDCVWRRAVEWVGR